MDDLILRAAAIDAIVFNSENKFAVDVLNDVPAVDAVPVVHARWQGVSPFVDSEECSNCRYCIQSKEFETPYCPWCGAKMEE